MSDSTTANYGWAYPTVGADSDTWGATINATIVSIDADLKTVDDGLAARLVAANNLSDLADKADARDSLELGNAALKSVSDGSRPVVASIWDAKASRIAVFRDDLGSITYTSYVEADLLVKSGNLAGISSLPSARSNLGLGSIATHNVTISSSAPSGGSDGDIWLQYVP